MAMCPVVSPGGVTRARGGDRAKARKGVQTSLPLGHPESISVSSLAVSPADLLGPLNDVERKYAPPALYVSGRLTRPLAHPRVAIVGTRSASNEGLSATKRLSRELAIHGVVVVSGLAEGIDTAAHTAAIEAGGMTIAVLGTPLDQVYPKQNVDLQAKISSKFLTVSQFPSGYPIQRQNFVLRNRTMALLSDATVIMESGEKGGALHQGWEAIRLGRPLFIRRSVMEDERLSWPREMMRYGATDFEHFREVLRLVPTSWPELTVAALAKA